MDLHEYQSKIIMCEYGINIPVGIVVQKDLTSEVVTTEEIAQMKQAVAEIMKNSKVVVVKAQVHAGGRGKAGGVKVFKDSDQAIEYASGLLGKKLVTQQTDAHGQFISAVYFESGCNIIKEYYLSMLVNRDHNCVSIIVSTEGGMDIETVAHDTPEAIHTIDIDPITGYSSFYAIKALHLLDLNFAKYFKQMNNLLGKLYKMFTEKDVSLLEINPLVVAKNTEDEELMVLDAKISIDDNGLYRQKSIVTMRDQTQEDSLDREARNAGLSYIKLDGNIGCMVNGAGLAMATMDIIQYYGGSAANFLDVGGGATKEGAKIALSIILKDSNVNAVLINIFGGIVKCDMIADSVVAAVKELKAEGKNIPYIVVRLEGTNAQAGAKIISESGLDMIPANDLDDAAKKVVAVSKK